MWSTLDIILGFAFMIAWVIAVAAGFTAVITVYCLLVARQIALKAKST